MRLGGLLAGLPLFFRVFLLMLSCVVVVQSMNLLLLAGVKTPYSRAHSIAEIVQAIETGSSHHNYLLGTAREIPPAKWSPRGERVQYAVATALGVPVDDVSVRFPQPFLQREEEYIRTDFPPPTSISQEVALNAIMIGEFVVAVRQSDGSWKTVEYRQSMEFWRMFAVIWLVLSAAAVAPFAWALARRLTLPIAGFAAAADRLGRDPHAAPLLVEGPREIAAAAAAFNRMQSRLNRYVEGRATVVGAIAHDLRTPLMRLGLRLESAPIDLRTACEADIRDMEAMVGAALAYMRDTNTLLERRALDLRSLAETVIDDLSDRGAAVSLSPGEPVVLDGHATALKAMMSNLVGNAVKYAGGAEVEIVVSADQARLLVRDRGPGLAPEDLDRVFEPFFRAEKSRNRNTGGIGLGLASVRATARAHGGDAHLDNREGGGLVVEVILPL